MNEYSETISSVTSANKNKLSQIDEELKLTIDKRSLGVIAKDNEMEEKESMYTKKKDINTKAINIAKKVKDVYLIIVNLRNDYSTYRQDDYKQVNKLCVSRNKILPLKNDNQRVVRIVEDKELVDMVRKE